jgi:hypothetical protein
MKVTRCGASTPNSPSARTVSSLLVGSITRASTSARNASSFTRPRPISSYIWLRACHKTSDDVLHHRRRACPASSGLAQIQDQLPGAAAFLGDLQQQRQLVLVMSRPDVLDPQHLPAPLVHDLDGSRT